MWSSYGAFLWRSLAIIDGHICSFEHCDSNSCSPSKVSSTDDLEMLIITFITSYHSHIDHTLHKLHVVIKCYWMGKCYRTATGVITCGCWHFYMQCHARCTVPTIFRKSARSKRFLSVLLGRFCHDVELQAIFITPSHACARLISVYVCGFIGFRRGGILKKRGHILGERGGGGRL